MIGRIVRLAALFAGPAALIASLAALVAYRDLFAHGPGVPTAGREEAWTLLWGCFALVLAGHVVSLPATMVVAGSRLLRRQPLGWAVRATGIYHAVVALALVAWARAVAR